jgi:hypothetical protein
MRGARLNRLDRAVLDALLPAGANAELPLGALDSGFEDFLAEFESQGATQLRWAFGLSLVAAAWLAPLLIRRLPPLTRLEPDDRERALESMDRSNITILRQLMRVLKTVVGLHYGAVPGVRRAIGYHP